MRGTDPVDPCAREAVDAGAIRRGDAPESDSIGLAMSDFTSDLNEVLTQGMPYRSDTLHQWHRKLGETRRTALVVIGVFERGVGMKHRFHHLEITAIE
jgi:hypothetical protein